MALPTITIVTPSFNQAAYLPETIDSVLSQNYPNLRYIIMDGGSTDCSVEIIQRSQRHLAYWQSQRDGGQADALNQGFAVADRWSRDNPAGAIYAYLNSDDLYTAGTLRRVGALFEEMAGRGEAQSGWVSGNVENFGAGSAAAPSVTAYPAEQTPLDRWFWFYANPVHQPGAFWSAALHRRFGPFDAGLRYVFDYDLFMKFRILADVRPVHVNETLARFRLHGASKTVTERPKFDAEFARVRERIAAELSGEQQGEMRQYVRRTRADRLQADAVQHLRNGQRVPALRELIESLWHDPRLLVQRRTLGALKRFVFA